MKSNRRAFTLMEMIVVIAIIMILVTILVASLRKPRGQAHQAVCIKNLRNIGDAALDYANRNTYYPSGWWMNQIKDRIEKDSKEYRCPADTQQLAVTGDPDNMILSYGINRSEFDVEAPLDPADYCFYNGVKKYRVKRPSETIIFADCTPSLYYCGIPGPAAVFLDPVQDVDYRHMDDSFCAAFCDGHAEALTTTIQKQWDASQ